MGRTSGVKLLKNASSCLNCSRRIPWNDGYMKEYGTEFDKCRLETDGSGWGGYIESLMRASSSLRNPKDCSFELKREFIKNTRLWVTLYFKGRERDWIIVEENRHEIFIEGNWFVRKVFGIADKFHAWQDKRREKRWLVVEAKRRAAVLTHIVKELPRV